MKLVGVRTGIYEGNKWARINVIEPFNTIQGCIGDNVLSLKADFNFCSSLLNQPDLMGKEVRLYYDRFGKVQDMELLS